MENNGELSGQSPKQNEEIQVQYPDHHEELPGQSLEQKEEFPVQFPEHHEESPKQSPDCVTIDVVHAATSLTELHRHVDGGHWKEVT